MLSSVRRTAALALLAAPLAGGCVINASSNSEVSGRYVSEATIQRIQPGKDAEYVLALLGEPSSRTQVSDGTEIWKWGYRKEKRSGSGIAFVFSGKSTTTTEHTTYVELKDGVVVKSWRD